jgi:peptide-methionine (S)-S-oxide reductase
MRINAMKIVAVLAAAGMGAAALMVRVPARAADAHAVPAPAQDITTATGPQTIVLSGGCFWGVQGVYEHVRGVQRAVSGYAGGAKDTADYETVSTGTTGHAESVQITYDPKQISYGRLLQIYFSVVADPTLVNRQGPDEGTQYRSEIFTSTPDEARVAAAYIAQLNAAHVFNRPIATRVDALPGFYPAEGYHQDFLEHNPDYPYIVYNDLPKVAALKAVFPDLYQATATLTGVKS